MNPHDWKDHVERLERHLDSNHQSGVGMGHAPRSNTDWDTCHELSGYTVVEPHSSNVGWNKPSPPSQKVYNKDPEVKVEDSDGGPLEMSEEDTELARKRKELEEIEERILHKKASIAMKTVGLFTKKMTPAGVSCDEPATTCKGETLRDRVKGILQQRHPHSFLSKVQSTKGILKSSSLSKDGLLQEHHPLKLRVKALMKQRSCDPCVLPPNSEKVPDVILPHPSPSVTSPAKEENSVNKGFERFLSMLNKGVDVDLLSKIVNDDRAALPLGEEHLNIQQPGKSEPPVRSESPWLSSGPSLPGCSRTNSAETKTETPCQERSFIERLSLTDDEGKREDRGDCSSDSRSRSKSPLAVKKKRKQEEEESPKVDEQHQQLQNILKTLGFSLEVDEMSKLADRTQERLYGKKSEGSQRTDSQGVEESQQRCSQRDRSRSLSTSSSSSSSSPSTSSSSRRSTSRSLSPRPSLHRRSHSGDGRQRRKSERSHSGERSVDGLTCQDSKEAQRHGDREEQCKQISTYQHAHQQNQTFPYPPPAASAFPNYNFSQYSHYTDSINSGDSYWTYIQSEASPLLPSSYPSTPYPHHNFPGPTVARNMIYPHISPPGHITSIVNPNLGESEGQKGSSAPRCLTVIKTVPSAVKLPKPTKKKQNKAKQALKRRLKRKRRKEKKRKANMASQLSAQVKAASQVEEGNSAHQITEQSEEKKLLQTEEEIKTNLRKKLKAFNQKAKNTSQLLHSQVMKPATSLASQIG